MQAERTPNPLSEVPLTNPEWMQNVGALAVATAYLLDEVRNRMLLWENRLRRRIPLIESPESDSE